VTTTPTSTRRLVGALALALVLGSTAVAQEPNAGGHPAAESAEQHADGIENWWTWDYKEKHLPPPFGFALINFAIFCAVMYKLAAAPLREFVRDRHDRVRNDLDAAAKLNREARERLSEAEKRIAGVDAEIDRVVSTIRQEAEAEKARAIAAAEEQARRLKTDAEKQIAAEIERARGELRRGVVEAAVALAEELLRKQIGADDQRKLAEGYVTELEKEPPSTEKGAS
jgi:ATP synthase F0 subunit b